ncbi:ABC transporter permease [Thermogemmatispora sp.]|uniref:ABC transporter permease n=1 Tax=Thermogemmatispora sp. TaxID=1968838 RepID=UPI001DE7F505|nr:ABC transporter permease [Thermogemmatispora sp.]MBX5449861.1 ABC transporter permease [Thermogemmatispora sp.]
MTLLALRAQSKLELLRFLRNGRALFFTLLVPIGYYLIFSYGFGNTHDLQLHFGIAMAGFGTIGVSLGTLGSRLAQERQLGWLRLLQTTPLSPLTYFAAKVIATFSMAGMTIICVLTVALLEGLRVDNYWALVTSALILWGGSLPFIALAFVIGSWTDAETGYVVSIGVYLVLGYLGGLLQPLQLMPGVLQDVARFLPSAHYLLLALRPLQAAPSGSALEDVLILLVYTVLFTALAIWSYRRAGTADR